MDVVTADGVLRQVDADSEPDLFWALRGGKGNAGIVTSMTFELLPLARIYGGASTSTGSTPPELLPAYAGWTATVPEACAPLCTAAAAAAPRHPRGAARSFTVQFCVAWPGEPGEGDALAPMREVAPPIADLVGELPCTDLDRVFNDPEHPVPAAERCLLLPGLPEGAIGTLLELAGPGAPTPLLAVALRHLGAALARPPEVPDAVGARDAAYLLQTVGVLAGPDAADVPGGLAAVRSAMEGWSTGASFVNLHGAPGDAADRARAWPTETYERLRRVKDRYDPAGLLRFGHSIQSAWRFPPPQRKVGVR